MQQQLKIDIDVIHRLIGKLMLENELLRLSMLTDNEAKKEAKKEVKEE